MPGHTRIGAAGTPIGVAARTRIGMPGALAALLAVSVLAGASLVRQDVAVQPQASLPAVLAAGADGVTVLGPSATSATTTLSGVAAVAKEVLNVDRQAGSWSVRLQLLSATGFGPLDSATVRTTLDATTEVQAIVALGGSITQSTGLPLGLAGASDLSITATGTKVSAGSSTLTFQVLFVPAAGNAPAIAYTFVLALA